MTTRIEGASGRPTEPAQDENTTALAPEIRRQVLDLLQANGANREFTSTADPFLSEQHTPFRGLDPGVQEHILNALALSPSDVSVRRLQALCADGAFRGASLDEQQRQIDDCVFRRVAPDPGEMLERSGARAPERSESGPGWLSQEARNHVAVHAFEHASRGLTAIVTLPLSVLLSIRDVSEQIEEARRLGRESGGVVAHGNAFVRQLVELSGGPVGRRANAAFPAADASGADRARRLWNEMPPDARAQLRAMTQEERRAFDADLQRLMERRTVG